MDARVEIRHTRKKTKRSFTKLPPRLTIASTRSLRRDAWRDIMATSPQGSMSNTIITLNRPLEGLNPIRRVSMCEPGS